MSDASTVGGPPEVIRLHRKKRLKLLEEQMSTYSKLRILVTVYNNVYGRSFVSVMKATCAIQTVQSVFVCVRLSAGGGLLVLAFGLTCLLIAVSAIITFVSFLAMVNDYSGKLKGFLRNQKFHGKLARRILNAYRVESVKSGSFYGIKRVTCLTLFALISNLSSSILISVKL